MKYDLFDRLEAPQGYTKSVQLEREFVHGGISYLVSIDAQLKLWPEHYEAPRLDYLWPSDVFDQAGHQVTDKAILDALQAMVKEWIEGDCCDTLCDELERKSK